MLIATYGMYVLSPQNGAPTQRRSEKVAGNFAHLRWREEREGKLFGICLTQGRERILVSATTLRGQFGNQFLPTYRTAFNLFSSPLLSCSTTYM